MKILAKDKVEALLDKLSQQAEVFAPMTLEQGSGFYPWNEDSKAGQRLLLDALNVYVSPKYVLFPQTEKMYDLEQKLQDLNMAGTHEDSSERILFGVRACDARAIRSLDDVFLTRGFVDSFYKARRDHVTIIGNACYNPGPNCFCQAMGVQMTEPETDVIIRDTGEQGYIWEPRSEKGEKLTTAVSEFLHDQELSAPLARPFPLQVDYEGVAEKLRGMFEHPIWKRLAEPCVNCGACTYICPSCHCFDIQVKMWGEAGYRFRCWDSCMYAEYTAEAGGGNPRPTGVERFRNRFLHKLEFFNERYGYSLCTGCGRCTVVCPTGVNITDIIKQIKEVDSRVGL
jgi:sulfhydrogenase subunit beta (sulfur reductase)